MYDHTVSITQFRVFLFASSQFPLTSWPVKIRPSIERCFIIPPPLSFNPAIQIARDDSSRFGRDASPSTRACSCGEAPWASIRSIYSSKEKDNSGSYVVLWFTTPYVKHTSRRLFEPDCRQLQLIPCSFRFWILLSFYPPDCKGSQIYGWNCQVKDWKFSNLSTCTASTDMLPLVTIVWRLASPYSQ